MGDSTSSATGGGMKFYFMKWAFASTPGIIGLIMSPMQVLFNALIIAIIFVLLVVLADLLIEHRES